MIGIPLMGRLGNMLFGLATGETWRRSGMNVIYTNFEANMTHFKNGGLMSVPFTEYFDIFENLKWEPNVLPSNVTITDLKLIKLPYQYYPEIPHDGCLYHSLFQSEKNFPDHDYIRFLFEPSKEVKNRLVVYDHLLEGVTCSVHVRRGDYVKQQHIHPVQEMDYYDKAGEIIGKVDRYLVFSDDIEWCKLNFKHQNCTFIEDKDYLELFLMSRCTHHIIGNSSFSWWGAWLGEKEGETKVIAPIRWFGEKHEINYDKDLIPERWMRIA